MRYVLVVCCLLFFCVASVWAVVPHGAFPPTNSPEGDVLVRKFLYQMKEVSWEVLPFAWGVATLDLPRVKTSVYWLMTSNPKDNRMQVLLDGLISRQCMLVSMQYDVPDDAGKWAMKTMESGGTGVTSFYANPSWLRELCEDGCSEEKVVIEALRIVENSLACLSDMKVLAFWKGENTVP